MQPAIALKVNHRLLKYWQCVKCSILILGRRLFATPLYCSKIIHSPIFMNRYRKHFFIAAIVYILFSVLIDLRNYLVNGEIFIVNGDILDSLHFYLNIPGRIISFILIFIVYQNIHNYDFYFLWASSLLFNSLLYGFLVYLLVPYIIKLIRRDNINNNKL